MHACVLSCFSPVEFFVTLWTVACQNPLSMGTLQARTLEWVDTALLQGICPTQGSNPSLLMSSALLGRFFTTSATWKAQRCINVIINLSKPTECKTLKWNPNVNYGLWVIKKKKFIYQNVFSNKNWLGHRLHSILVGA